jgi:hypothetical protein
MRRIVSILFLSLMLLQAIPVLHFFSSQKEVFYTYIDEEKPDEKSGKEKKAGKEYLSFEVETPVDQLIQTAYSSAVDNNYSSPTLAFLTRPPDAC